MDDGYLATIDNNGWIQLGLLFDGGFTYAGCGIFDSGLPIDIAANGTARLT